MAQVTRKVQRKTSTSAAPGGKRIHTSRGAPIELRSAAVAAASRMRGRWRWCGGSQGGPHIPEGIWPDPVHATGGPSPNHLIESPNDRKTMPNDRIARWSEAPLNGIDRRCGPGGLRQPTPQATTNSRWRNPWAKQSALTGREDLALHKARAARCCSDAPRNHSPISSGDHGHVWANE